MEVSGDDIANVVLEYFDSLPAKRKPQVRGSGLREWVPLSAIVAQRHNSLKCLAAATGMKCLPQNKIPQAQGFVLHDWHAEVLAIRSFNRFILEECHALTRSGQVKSEYVRFRTDEERTEKHFQPFALNEGIKLHMYCSEAPCGDASMELTMAAQADATPWTLPDGASALSPPGVSATSAATSTSFLTSDGPSSITLHGRGYFSSLGIVRRKPSRPDSPPTLSKSCSDKLAHKQCTSLLSSTLSLLVSPSSIYISTLTLPESQYSATAFKRAFSREGRMAGLFPTPAASPLKLQLPTLQEQNTSSVGLSTANGPSSWLPSGYNLHPFTILTTTREFAYSRRQEVSTLSQPLSLSPTPIDSSSYPTPSPRLTPSPLSTSTTPHFTETLISGVLQGRKQRDPRGASLVSRVRIWKLALQIATLLVLHRGEKIWKRRTDGERACGKIEGSGLDNNGSNEFNEKVYAALKADTYAELKGSELLDGRRRVKADVRREALKGWIVNGSGDGFSLEAPEGMKARH